MNPLLDPAAAAAAGRAHGQLATALASGGLVLSAQKLVEIGARAQLLIAPGIFRLDARPQEDSLQVMTRALGIEPPQWETDENPPAAYGEPDTGDDVPYRASWRFRMGGAAPLTGRVLLLTTFDLTAQVGHFTLHAVIRERGLAPPATPAS